MSFRLFVYYSIAWGAAAALFGWALGRLIGNDESLGGGALRGLSLGLFLGLALSLLDARTVGARSDRAHLMIRAALALILGAVGGLLGGMLGQLIGEKVALLRALGWTLAGLLVGA